jgi:glucokinase-like ROK family protein
MKIIGDFIHMGLVCEVGKGESTGGKPPVLLKIAPNSHFFVGVDLGANNIICVAMDTVNIIARTIVPTGFIHGFDHVVEKIKEAVDSVLKSAQISRGSLVGIGVAAPGLLDMENRRIIFSPDLGWRDVDILTPLKEYFDVYVCMDNATRATALGEKIFGCARNATDFMCINIGYGIGGAIVFGGDVYAGSSGSAGELGHITVLPNGPLCDCGNRGCLEAVASARALVRDARDRINNGEQTILNSMMDGDINRLDAKMIYDAAKGGDTLASEIVHNAVWTLGAAIAGFINLLDLELIVLVGGISRNGSFFLEMLNQSIEVHKMNYAGLNTKIRVSELGSDATAIGAGALVINQFLEMNEEIPLFVRK